MLETSEVDAIDPVDVFIEKKKWKMLPPTIKLRNKQGSICRLRRTTAGTAHAPDAPQ